MDNTTWRQSTAKETLGVCRMLRGDGEVVVGIADVEMALGAL